jgi:hypothetical protein
MQDFRVHFAAVGETSPQYLNMIKVLLYSFRKNAGIYRNSPFTIVTNGSSFSDKDYVFIKDHFSPINIVTMPPLGGTPHNNKFNAFYAISELSYDILVLLDCDIVVLDSLDNIVRNIDITKPYFKAILASMKTLEESIIGYERLVDYYAGSTTQNVGLYNKTTEISEYPLFNSGVLVMTNKAVLAIRNDVIRISYDLYQKRNLYSFSLKNYLNVIASQFIQHSGAIGQIIKKTQFIKGSVTYYPLWLTEQMALAIALMKHKISYEILDTTYNYIGDASDIKEVYPKIFHYLKGLYKIDRKNLLTGSWIEEYSNSTNPQKKALACLINEYNFEIGEQ